MNLFNLISLISLSYLSNLSNLDLNSNWFVAIVIVVIVIELVLQSRFVVFLARFKFDYQEEQDQSCSVEISNCLAGWVHYFYLIELLMCLLLQLVMVTTFNRYANAQEDFDEFNENCFYHQQLNWLRSTLVVGCYSPSCFYHFTIIDA